MGVLANLRLNLVSQYYLRGFWRARGVDRLGSFERRRCRGRPCRSTPVGFFFFLAPVLKNRAPD
jgi:hypothetical protein